MRRRRGRSPVLLLPLLGMLVGGLSAPWWIQRLAPPVPLDPAQWTVLVHGRNDGMADGNLSNGTGQVDGSLLISQRSFGRSDLLMPKNTQAIGALELSLAPSSSPVCINYRAANGFVTRIGEFSPTAWRSNDSQNWSPRTGLLRVDFHDSQLWMDGKGLAVSEPGTIEISAGGAHTQIQAIRLWDLDKNLWMDENFSDRPLGMDQRLLVAMGGGLVGALLAALLSNGVHGLVGLGLLLPLLAAAWIPYPEWRALGQRLYLVRTAPGMLRLAAFFVGLLPLFAGTLLSTAAFSVDDRAERSFVRWIPLLVAVDLLACRELSGLTLLAGLPGLLWLLLPFWVGRRADQSPDTLLLRDLPALGLVGGLGWGLGLLPALLWRLLALTADATVLLERNPRAGTDGMLLLLACLPLGMEMAIRASYLEEAWDPVHLAGASLGTEDRNFDPFWFSRCGDAPPHRTLYAFGGSSTGGAYQFKDNPNAFFVAQLHQRICARGEGETLTYNYGNSGRDSWDISQAAPALYQKNPPDLVLYYGGVNDLLTQDAPLTRKQQAALLAARSAPVNQLDALARSLRTVTGLGLLLRPQTIQQPLVAAVPLEDAEENLRSLARATGEAGGELWLVPEYAEPYVATQLRPYWEMEKRLATEIPHVHFVDIYGTLVGSPEELLVDRNHLSRIGSTAVADLLLPALDPFLQEGDAHE